ncbi:MAG TPA: cofactor-independent phosphoglycerate mutase [bacterium]|jgi:2,3-bisphosphoglycerate-independent phosphoglycerate mutase|nr:cofactor-independent phosphoglycerate mutase [bacterium]
MKYVVVLMDGVSDRPSAALGGRTPLQAAHKPNLDRLCAAGTLGSMKTGPESLPMGSDVGNMAVLGYDPSRYYSGRAPLEAKALGVEVKKGEFAFRANLVHVADGVMDDYSAGHISTEEGRELIKMLDKRLGSDKIRLAGGTQYRHLALLKGSSFENAKCTPPHDITGRPIEEFLPKGAGHKEIRRLMDDSRFLLEGHEVNRERRSAGKKTANMVWLWGQGRAVELPSFAERYGLKGSVITAVDLIRGLGVAVGLDVVEVPGATGWIDSNFKGKAEAALKSLKKKDFVFVHLEATDEAGHKGDAQAKVKAVELIDAEVVGRIAEGLAGAEWRLLVTPDHATPLETRTHAYDAVPYFVYDSTRPSEGGKPYTEADALAAGKTLEKGWDLMPAFLRGSAAPAGAPAGGD